MTLAAGARLGPYEILALLGAGGMGEVYRARDTRLGREVAIKVLPEALSSDAGRLRRFEKEAQSASSLNHPHIITVFDIGTDGPTSYIAMELVDGVTLRQLLVDGPLPQKRLLTLASQVAEGLAKAHGVGIVHRDLKPENVMVTRDGFAKILDFGLAKLTQPEEASGGTQAATVSGGTEPGMVVGTVAYMSPEQTLGKPLDFRSDQFSFGSMLYEMLTGKRAFARATGPETMTAIIREEPEPLATAMPSTPVPLRWIVERCLAKDPEERYAATRDLARDIARLQQGLSEGSVSGMVAAAEPRPPDVRRYLWMALTLMAGTAIGALAMRRAPAPVPNYHAVSFRRGTIDQARFAPDGQTIVYGAALEGKPSQLFSTRVDSNESTPLPLPADSILASISSSGMLAVALQRGSGPTLAEVSLAGGSPRELLEHVWRADWSPNGKGLAVVRDNRIEFPIGKVLGGAREGFQLKQLRFSPDGSSIAALEIQKSTEGASSVVVFGLDGKRRTVSSGWGFASGLAWHPGTGEIWFSPRDLAAGSFLMLCAVSPASGKSRVIARLPGIVVLHDIARDGRVLLDVADWHQSVMLGTFGSPVETNVSWLDFSGAADISDDGKTLLLDESGRGGGARGSVYLRKTDGSPATRLGDGIPFSLSPDGKWAITTPGSSFDRLVLLPTGAGEPKVLQEPGMTYRAAVWVPGSQRLVFMGQAVGRLARIYLQDVAGGAPRPVTPEGFGMGPVSPDGKLVVAVGSDGKLVLYPIEGGAPRTIPGLEAGEDVIRFDATGHAVFVATGDLPLEIIRLDLESGRRERIGEINPSDRTGAGGIVSVALTADGRTYAYTIQRRLSTLYLVTGLK
ncbi:MAG TPA: protein kinase [Thermoanaerobaculia bacterium]|nr:protein kinase [Thermoanaerobaculia bacterium]